MNVVTILLILTAVVIILLLINTYLSYKASKASNENLLGQFQTALDYFEKSIKGIETSLKNEISQNRLESGKSSKEAREELMNAFRIFSDTLVKRMADAFGNNRDMLDSFSKQLVNLTETNDKKMDLMRRTIEERIKHLQDENTKKLDQMRMTVDEKLQSTLEKRLGESFKLVSERLEMVHKGLGEMQTLAASVGDLKNVLTKVKPRGIWGEIQLGILLEQVLAPEQYAENVATKKRSGDRVEFAIRLPGRTGERDDTIWLPIDAKFPQEDYQRLVEAQEKANPSLAEEAAKRLESVIKNEAKTIREKYVDPPETTDFAIMYLPTEGLYAEIVRRAGLCEFLQRECRVVVAGPTTLAALLNSLQMGFRTLAIEKRSSEVWKLLGAIKTEFGRFGMLLDKAKKKIDEAGNTIGDASRKSRTIERKLKKVEELPAAEAADMIEFEDDLDDESDERVLSEADEAQIPKN
ncbi:MAG TPA: DNA recombination protein RmuC [Spirochaetota bacterium]|nr:DNA recombination protein RmuC [Spirochaetota bacterium]